MVGHGLDVLEVYFSQCLMVFASLVDEMLLFVLPLGVGCFALKKIKTTSSPDLSCLEFTGPTLKSLASIIIKNNYNNNITR